MPNQCGSCTLCCKLLGVPELKKPPGKWCAHCTIGKGCKIYPERPQPCVDFECGWLISNLPLEYRPDHSHMVMTGENDKTFFIHIDPNYPNATETKIGQKILDLIHKSGLSIILVTGDKRKLLSTSFRELEKAQALMKKMEIKDAKIKES
jgi:hypothetical protein